MKKICAVALFGAVTAVTLFAEETEDMSILQQTLDEATEIATKTKMNIDYVPSVVSVQRGDKLKLLGANTVYDALEMLPGIQMQVNQLGQIETVVRGFKNPNSAISDKIKVLLDGVPVSSETFSTAGYVMNFPLELVDRIEVLRGPGSTIYGSGAFYGAVNIVTKSHNNNGECGEVFAGFGSWEYRKFGAIGCTTKDGVRYSADGYYQGSDRKLQLDKTYTTSRTGNLFPRDFTTNEGFYDYSTGFMLQDDNFSWSVRLKKSRQGNYYGKEEQLEPTTNTGQTSQYINTEIKYKTQNSFVKSETTAGIRDYSFDINKVDYDASKYSAYSSSAFDFNYYNTYTVAETTYYANEQHTFKKYHNNQIVLNYGVEYTKIRDNHFWSNLESFAFANPGDALIAGKYSSEVALLFPQSNQYLQDGIHRTTLQAGLEDTYNINEQTDLTIGARYSKESDLSNNLYDYRIGLVSRWMNDKLITKLMYSTGFRAPNFSELYTRPHINFEAGNDQIVPEQIKSYEAMLIYKPNSIHRFSINGYFSSFDNIIDLDQNHASISGYTQYQGRISKGLEAEYAYTPSITHEFSVNASFNQTTYINTDDVSISQDMPDVSPVMYKAWYLYRPTNQLSMGIKYQYIGKTTQNDATNRVTSLPSQQKTDLNLKYKISKETSVDFYLDNILNATQRMPTYFYHDVRANYGITNDGMVREGRNFIAEITHKF